MAIGGYQMKWSDWKDFNSTSFYTLTEGDGEKQVNYKVQDSAGNTADVVFDKIILDTTSPGGPSIEINDGAQKTDSTKVTLKINANDDTSGVYQISFSNDGLTWSDWENYTQTLLYTLPEGDGTKTIYFKVKDKAGNTAGPVSADIILDTTPSKTEPEDQKVGEEKEAGMDMFVIGVILVIIIIIAIFFVVYTQRKKNKQKLEEEEEEEEIPVSAQVTPVPQPVEVSPQVADEQPEVDIVTEPQAIEEQQVQLLPSTEIETEQVQSIPQPVITEQQAQITAEEGEGITPIPSQIPTPTSVSEDIDKQQSTELPTTHEESDLLNNQQIEQKDMKDQSNENKGTETKKINDE
jgi:hypothetical protein